MGQLLDVGTQPGNAAPGEYSPSALLTTRGGIIVCNSAGVPVAVARGAAGTFIGSDGSDTLPRYPPGYLLARDNGGAGTPLNTTSETTVLNAVMTGALPAFVAVGDRVNLRAWGIAAFAIIGTLTLNVYGGATKIAAGSASGNFAAGVPRAWQLDLWIHLLSATTVTVDGLMLPRISIGTGFGSAGDVHGPGTDVGTAVTVSTLPLAIDIKAICSTATATTQITCKGAEATYHPKNY